MKSFLEGRQVVSRDNTPQTPRIAQHTQLPNFGRVPEDSTVAMLPETMRPTAHVHQKQVETEMVDGVVHKIIVTCGCGERIEVYCGY